MGKRIFWIWILVSIVLTACGPSPNPRPVPITDAPQPPGGAVPKAPATELPPIPEFDELLYTIAGGGGGDNPCLYDLAIHLNVDQSLADYYNDGWEYPGELPFVYRSDHGYPSIAPKVFQALCVWAPYFGDTVEVTLVSPSGLKLTRTETGVLENGFSYVQYPNASLFGVFYNWPVEVPGLAWTVTIRSADWVIERTYDPATTGQPVVGVINPDRADGTLPPDYFLNLPYETPNLRVGAINHPAGKPVYFLLYKLVQDLSEAPGADPQSGDIVLRWIQSRVEFSDDRGFAMTAFDGPFEPDSDYIILTTTDPGGFDGRKFRDNPGTGFSTTSPPDALACPGAPPQQMVVGQRGRVCTKSDPVLLRADPNRAAEALERLAPGIEFLVANGPECADDWSWWYVQLDSGEIGWLAEGGDETDPYFICPMP